jgi:hypothetical protein
MKRLWTLSITFTACLVGQSLDFASLDKLEAKAKEVSRISLDENQLRAVAKMMLSDKNSEKNADQLRKLAAGLTSVTVRSLEFAKAGQYQEADLKGVRSQFANLKSWSKIIDTKEDGEHTEIYMLTEGDKPKGIAVLSAEPTELTVIFIKGALSLSDLGSLGELTNLPTMRLGPNAAVTEKK